MKKSMIAVFFTFFVLNANAQWGRPNPYNRPRQPYNSPHYDNHGGYKNQNYGDRINDFQREARRRIADGIANGNISSREAKRLLQSVEQIEYKEQNFWRDGFLDPRERQELAADLAYLEQDIWREKHDRERSNYDDYRQGREYYRHSPERFGNR